MQRERFPNLLKAGNTIGHTGHGAFPQGNADWTGPSLDKVMPSHLHFEIIYIEEEKNDKEPKSSFPTGQNFWYLNPEYYFNNLYIYKKIK